MSASPSQAPSWLQELKSNRRTQVALVALAGVLTWMLWPDAPKGKARPGSPLRAAFRAPDTQPLQALKDLPDLAKLNKAGELPGEARMYRDLFTFDLPAPPPPPPVRQKAVPPPPPLSPQELAAQKAAAALRQSRDAEWNARPTNLRYLGYLGSARSGRLGAFMKGEDPVSYKVGDTSSPNWRLVKLTDLFAEFQNTKYSDMLHKIEARDAQGGAAGSRPTNEY